MIERLGIGSFDDIVKGRVSGKIEVLDGAMNSLYSLCEGPTFAQRFLKQILFVLSDLRDGKINLKLKQCSDVFSFLSSHLLSSSIFSNLEAGQKAFHSTGWFARWVHSIQEWLADGERGFLREIRRYNMEALKSYYSFGDSLKRLCSELNAAPKSELDKTAFEKGLNSILPPVLDTTNTSYKIKSIDAQIAALKYELLTGLTDQERERVQKSINNKERDIADLLSTAQKVYVQ